jgi:hypothetical protein
VKRRVNLQTYRILQCAKLKSKTEGRIGHERTRNSLVSAPTAEEREGLALHLLKAEAIVVPTRNIAEDDVKMYLEVNIS